MTGLPASYTDADVQAYLPNDPTITAINSNVSNVARDLSSNVAILGSATGNIATLQGNISNLTTAISHTNSNVSNVANDLSTLSNTVSNGTVSSANTVANHSQPNITSVGTLTGLVVNGNITTTGSGKFVGDGSQLTNLPTGVLITSNVTSVVTGGTLSFSKTTGNTQYPGGIFTLEQRAPLTISLSDAWASGGTDKNAYTNYVANTVNSQNISVVLSLSNATFNVLSSDSINIGSTTITGTHLTSLNITGTGGTYTIPSAWISSADETASSINVSANISTDRGVQSITGTALTTTQPVAFSVDSLSGSFTNSSVPYFSKNQTVSWSAGVTGSPASGNITMSGNGTTVNLTNSAQTSGTSTSVDSTASYTISTSDFTGAGLNGYGNMTIPTAVTTTVTPATAYIPMFYKITSSSSNPNFTTSDNYLTHDYVLGDGVISATDSAQYTWVAIPGTATHSFVFDLFGAQAQVDIAATYTNQTIAGQTYTVYGFANFSAATNIYTVI